MGFLTIIMADETSDVELACRLIKRHRKYGRTHLKNKTITIELKDLYNGNKISTVSRININIATSNIAMGHGLKCRNIEVYPGTKGGKLKCESLRALELLEKHRSSEKEYYAMHREERCEKSMGYFIEHRKERLKKSREYYVIHREERIDQIKEYQKRKKIK